MPSVVIQKAFAIFKFQMIYLFTHEKPEKRFFRHLELWIMLSLENALFS